MNKPTGQQYIDAKMEVEVVYALPRCTHSVMLSIPQGTTVQQALDLAAKHEPFSKLDMAEHPVGIYYEVVKDPGRILVAGDRVEIYRPLLINPMQQRHARANKQKPAETKRTKRR